jgi:hypothetical protein
MSRNPATPEGGVMPTQKSWRAVLPVHPAAGLFPLMSEAELRDLGEDIRKNGLTSPIVLWQADPKESEQLLDGRNRLDAIELITGKPVEIGAPSLMAGDFLATDRVITLDKSVEPYTYVISANIRRRHLNVEQRQHLLIEIIARTPEKSDRQIAKHIGVDHKTIASARAKGEDVGRIPHVPVRTDTRGRQQPASKPKSATEITPPPPEPEVEYPPGYESPYSQQNLAAAVIKGQEKPPDTKPARANPPAPTKRSTSPAEVSKTPAPLEGQEESAIDQQIHAVKNSIERLVQHGTACNRGIEIIADLRNLLDRLEAWCEGKSRPVVATIQ